MKKFAIILVSIFTCLVSSYAQQYQTTFFSLAEWNSNFKTYVWSDWVGSDHIPIEVDVNNRSIKIYTEDLQNYIIFDQKVSGNDGSGDYVDYSAVDQNGHKCIVKTRIQEEGNVMQLCIYYDDIAWAYCIERT